MEKYSIIKSPVYCEFLVIANTYENPINDLLIDGYVPFIENGDVVFDLAVINGLDFNRFIRAKIQSHKLALETIEVLSAVPKDILSLASDYFKKNINILQQSTLPEATKYLLVHAYS